jgi:choline-sulfatase
MPHLVGKAECVRTSEWAYVYRHEERDELYDRSADPAETTNLLATDRAGDDDVAAVAAGLRDRLLAWMVETSDVIPWEADPRVPDIPQGWRGSG